MAKNKAYKTVSYEESVTEQVKVEEPVVVKTKEGIVSDCQKLNVRKEPNANAPIICELPAKTKVVIDDKASTKTFYKVCTVSGIEGFCMKKFITVL